MLKNKKQLVTIVAFVIIVAIGIAFYFWDRSNITVFDAKKYGLNCRIERTCDELVGIDCDAAADGPYYYINKNTGDIISKCGGYCMSECTNCPPKEWKCDTY